jgi:hypothetical protein
VDISAVLEHNRDVIHWPCLPSDRWITLNHLIMVGMLDDETRRWDA